MICNGRLLMLAGALWIVLFGALEAGAGEYDWIKSRGAAQEEETRFMGGQYLTLRGGGFFPNISINGRGTSFDVGTGVELAYGLRPIPYASLEASLGYYEADHISDHPDYFNDPVYLLSVVPLGVTLKGIIPVKDVEFYALGGAGMHYVMAKKRYAATSANTPVLETDDDEATTAFHYGGGIALKLGSASLAVEVRRIAGLKSNVFGNSFDIAGTFVYGAISMGF